MLKVVVFDSGWGGEMVANYIEKEITVIDVIRVIDWDNAPYANKTNQEICRLTEDALLPYIGNVDVIVLGGFVFLTIIDFLRKKYPEQKFVTVGLKPMSISLRATHNIMILANQKIKETEIYQNLLKSFKLFNIFEPKCDHWSMLIDEGMMNEKVLRRELAPFGGEKIDTVIVMNTHFWDIERELERVLGYQVRVIDQRALLKRDLCVALEFEGANLIV